MPCSMDLVDRSQALKKTRRYAAVGPAVGSEDAKRTKASTSSSPSPLTIFSARLSRPSFAIVGGGSRMGPPSSGTCGVMGG
jgi:hypothetical protein